MDAQCPRCLKQLADYTGDDFHDILVERRRPHHVIGATQATNVITDGSQAAQVRIKPAKGAARED